MTSNIEQWQRRYGVPPLPPAPRFRDDPMDGQQPEPEFLILSRQNAPHFLIRTATADEVRRGGLDPVMGYPFAKVARVWGEDSLGHRMCMVIVVPVLENEIETFNRASDDSLARLWDDVVRAQTPFCLGLIWPPEFGGPE